MLVDELSQEIGTESRMVAGDDEQPLRIADAGAGRAQGVARAERLLLQGDVLARERLDRVGGNDHDEWIGIDAADGFDHPVDEPSPEQGVKVLRRCGLHPRAEPRGHHDSSEVTHEAGAPGFEPGITGPKPAALPTWLRPTARSVAIHRGRRSRPLRRDAAALMVGAVTGASELGYAPPRAASQFTAAAEVGRCDETQRP